MKKYLWMSVAALWMTGCNNDGNELADNFVTNPVTIRATITGDADTRAVLGESDGTATPVYWSDGDKISLLIGDDTTPYTFTTTGEVGDKATSADFTYSDTETTLPTLTAGTTITATYPAEAVTDYASQAGTTDGVGGYIGMTATCTVTDGQSYEDLNLNFKNTTAIVRLTLTNTAFANADVSDVSLVVNDALTITATEGFTGDATGGSITVYLALPASTELTDGTITATCGEMSYIASITADKTLEAGKLYRVSKTMVTYDKTTNTYKVYNAEDLQAWNAKVRKNIAAGGEYDWMTGDITYNKELPNLILEADITLTGENNWTPIGTTTDDYEFFGYTGTIDGNGHTITGLHINNTSEEQGFVNLAIGGTVKNLTFANANVSAGTGSGIVAGCSFGTIENCYVTSGSSLTATGYNSSSASTGNGGIVGYNGGIVMNCTNAATIGLAQGLDNHHRLGGIAGNNGPNTGFIFGCINTGAVSGRSRVGGVVGANNYIVVACSNSGQVTGTERTGGIVGYSGQGCAYTIGSFTIATAESDNDGDGVGAITYGTVTECHSGDASTINNAVSAMNEAITSYNATATKQTCPYTWQAGNDDGYPALQKVTETESE